LQKQYRPPIDKICIEIPAGLIDPSETPEACAIRELHEETGYHGTAYENGEGTSCVMFNDPGMCNTNVQMVYLKIDLEDERNKKENLKPELEENEFIECFTCPLDELWDECRRLEKEGCAIDARVGTIAEGFKIAKVSPFFLFFFSRQLE